MGLQSWLRELGFPGFASFSTAELVTEGIDGSHLTAIVTGTTSGIGKETVRVLALRGVTVVMTARCTEKGRQVKESLLKENPTAKLHLMEMDLSSINSIISFARSFYGANLPLNILINNAGIFGCPFQLSDDGVELQFATNYLGHFLLTNLLLDKLKSTAKETGVEGRIVNVSSIAHRFALSSTMELDKINDPSNYHRYGAYIRSKLAILLHASELSKLLKEEACNVTINSLHPGIIPTNILRNNTYFDSTVMFFIKPILKNVAQGASTICYIALHPKLKGISGKYYAADCNEISASKYASDEKLSKRLWDFSQELIGNIMKPI
ncbi:short-chain dehydrogenase TIC 32, chloroplastic-like isoform X2 [Aristolochia californica]|uniref:short-chain dehydrogenase TIC 32, chloroplastic-like isoform X2 n=1 Tax=Aristolochia californica TaxID=171875 RepID=UPI0035D8D2E6